LRTSLMVPSAGFWFDLSVSEVLCLTPCLRSLAWNLEFRPTCSGAPSLINVSGAPQSCTNQSTGSHAPPFFSIGHAAAKNSLLANTWQHRSPCIELQRMSIVSVAKIPDKRFGSNMRSTRYLLANGTRADLTSFLVVALSVNAACAMLSPHLSLNSSGVVRECRSLDKKLRSGIISCSSKGPGSTSGGSDA
jgi:hypothetical protein